MTNVVVERLSADDFAPPEGLVYVDNRKLHPLYDKIAYHDNLILIGPKGIGKTLSISSWAAENNVPLVTVDCSEDIRRSHLIGMYILRGDESPFVLGPLPTAIEVANECGKCILCLDEINSLTPQMQKVLNPLGDFRKNIVAHECGRVFKLREESKLWLCGSMNTSVYGGVYTLNEDLKSRFRMLPLEYPTKTAEKKIIHTVLDSADQSLVDKVLTLAHETRQRSSAYALSTRDVVQVIEDVPRCGQKSALWMLSGKFEGPDRDFFLQRIESIFGMRLK